MSARDILHRTVGAARSIVRAERPIVLMYHRVETLSIDPWRLAVDPSRFARQIAVLGKTRRIVPLSWLVAKIIAGDMPRHVAAVTFDDGYGDVFRNALPVLDAYGCPATVFLTTGAVDSARGFWWDVLARIVLETSHLPERFGVDVEGVRHEFTVADQRRGAGLDRPTVLARLHALLLPLEPEPRDDALGTLAAAFGTDADPLPRDLAMSPDEVRSLAAGGLIEIGAHSVTHPPLTSRRATALEREVCQSHRHCEEMTGRQVIGFAYPFGDFAAASRSAVHAAGMKYACTTISRAVRRGCDPFAIPRLLVADWEEDDFRREVLSFG